MTSLATWTQLFLKSAGIRTHPKVRAFGVTPQPPWQARFQSPDRKGSSPVYESRPADLSYGRQDGTRQLSVRSTPLREGKQMQRFQVMDRRTNQTVLLFASSPEDALDRADIPARDGTVYAWQWVEGNRLEWVALQLGTGSPASGLREHQHKRSDARGQRRPQASGT